MKRASSVTKTLELKLSKICFLYVFHVELSLESLLLVFAHHISSCVCRLINFHSYS